MNYLAGVVHLTPARFVFKEGLAEAFVAAITALWMFWFKQFVTVA